MRESMGTERHHREANGARGGMRDAGMRDGGGRRRLSGNKAVEAARAYLEALTGKGCESVSGLSRVQDGWAVTIEVVELERVPRSTDILASYQVEVNQEGELMGYERVRRYYRNQPGCGE